MADYPSDWGYTGTLRLDYEKPKESRPRKYMENMICKGNAFYWAISIRQKGMNDNPRCPDSVKRNTGRQ